MLPGGKNAVAFMVQPERVSLKHCYLIERMSVVSRDGDSSASKGISVEGPEFDSFLII